MSPTAGRSRTPAPRWGSRPSRSTRPMPAGPTASRKSPASLGEHHVRGLDHRERLVAGLEGEIVDRLVGDRGGDDHPAADVDADVCGRLTLGHRDDLALELIARAEFHPDTP